MSRRRQTARHAAATGLAPEYTCAAMRALTAATISALAFVFAGALASAGTATGPSFGVYTSNAVIGGSTHLEASIHVSDPPTEVALTFECGKPSGTVTVAEVWNSAPVPLHGGGFSFDGRASITRFTLSPTNVILKRGTYASVVSVDGSFTRQGFSGRLSLGGSPCGGLSYHASRLPGPTLTSPAP